PSLPRAATRVLIEIAFWEGRSHTASAISPDLLRAEKSELTHNDHLAPVMHEVLAVSPLAAHDRDDQMINLLREMINSLLQMIISPCPGRPTRSVGVPDPSRLGKPIAGVARRALEPGGGVRRPALSPRLLAREEPQAIGVPRRTSDRSRGTSRRPRTPEPAGPSGPGLSLVHNGRPPSGNSIVSHFAPPQRPSRTGSEPGRHEPARDELAPNH